MIRNLIFDVDGTLWDSAESVAASWNEVLRGEEEHGREQAVTKEEIYGYMGHTMEEIARRMLPGLFGEKRTALMEKCMSYENEYLREHSGEFYPDCLETMEKLKVEGYRLYIVSNCQEGYIETMLYSGGISYQDPFYTAGGDSAPLISDIECFGRTQKGKAENIRLLMERNALLPEESIYIGDTAMDEAASDAAGISMIHAGYGFGEAKHPAGRLSALSALPELLKSLNEKAENTEE